MEKTNVDKKDKTIKALIATIIVISLLLIAAVVAFAVLFNPDSPTVEAENMLEGTYQRAYYNLVAEVNEMSVDLKKIDAATSGKTEQEYLYEVWNAGQSASSNLSSFDTSGEGGEKLKKFINQVQDYAYYLAKKTTADNPLSENEKQNLFQIGQMLEVVSDNLSGIQDDLKSGKSFLGSDGVLKSMPDVFENFVEPDVDYPTLIYDGPFSDSDEKSVSDKTEAVSVSKAQERIRNIFSLNDNTSIELVADTDEMYCFKTQIDESETYVNVTKSDAELLGFTVTKRVDAPKDFSNDEIISATLKYGKSLGFENLIAVWVEKTDGYAYVNTAVKENGVVIYPDIVKFKVALDDLKVLGVEASHYAKNHKERQFGQINITEADAVAKADPRMQIKNVRLAIIPYGEKSEKLCYELNGEINGGEYFVYIDCATGEELNILYVVNSDAGQLVL